MFPDFIITIIIAALWFIASSAWVDGVIHFKKYTDPAKIFSQIGCNQSNCAVISAPTYAGLNASLPIALHMSTNLAPSKCTVYISNLPFTLTNNDLHQMLKKYGKVVRVTIVKDSNRRSKGVAFVLFLDRNEACSCVQRLDGTEILGRKVKASIARDNGRAPEFIRRREYLDKTKCYECGEAGHLSYNCSKNLLGNRPPPPKKVKKRTVKAERHVKQSRPGENSFQDQDNDGTSELDELEVEAEASSTWSSVVVQYTDHPSCSDSIAPNQKKKRRIHKDAYFSDEEVCDDED